jgi:signal peptidase II
MSDLGSATVVEGNTTDGATAASPVSVRTAVLTLVVVAAGIIGLDSLTKELATNSLEGQSPVRLLGGAVYLSFTRNGGAAWSMGSKYTFIFPIVALAVAVYIGWVARKLRSLPWAIALGLILGGALGNMVDRILRTPGHFSGHVVDFISLFDAYGQKFPIFNVADMALTFGVILAILLEFTGRMRDGTRATTDRATTDRATTDKAAEKK